MHSRSVRTGSMPTWRAPCVWWCAGAASPPLWPPSLLQLTWASMSPAIVKRLPVMICKGGWIQHEATTEPRDQRRAHTRHMGMEAGAPALPAQRKEMGGWGGQAAAMMLQEEPEVMR